MWRGMIAKVIAQVKEKEETAQGQAQDALEAANQSQSRMESRYDTYREEFSKQAAAFCGTREACKTLRAYLEGLLHGSNLPQSNTVTIGTIALLDYGDGDCEYTLIVPFGGGDEIVLPQGLLRTVSKKTPLGASLLGHVEGDTVTCPGDPPSTVTIKEIHKA